MQSARVALPQGAERFERYLGLLEVREAKLFPDVCDEKLLFSFRRVIIVLYRLYGAVREPGGLKLLERDV
ncbi:unnamed protein product [Lasius platythorax]|uniref:Uncharacterized protein n=1 Tax=Lasius platythorax TaxID=488582 RepID=A0AAV2NXK0_9HYME